MQTELRYQQLSVLREGVRKVFLAPVEDGGGGSLEYINCRGPSWASPRDSLSHLPKVPFQGGQKDFTVQLFLAPSIFKCWSLPGLGPRNLTLNPIASHSNQSSAQLRVIITLGLILKPCERSKSIFKHMALSDVLLLSNPAPSVQGTTPASLRSTARANASQRELIS